MDIFDKGISAGKRKALEVAEEARESEWKFPSFVAKIFEGAFLWKLVHPFPKQEDDDKKTGDAFLAELSDFLKNNLDPDEVDKTGVIPEEVYQGLAKLGCFSMKIPKEYGGLGLSQVNYNRAVGLVASYCASTAVLLSAHQSIGVPQPLKLFGTPEQKQKYLTRFAKNKYISAFALTEVDVGSDPARMMTMAVPTADGKHYMLNGQKLWCTNGPIADIMIVMAQTPPQTIHGKERKQITAFIVEKTMPGVRLIHRCRFMGLNGIQNGLMEFKDVKVPTENILWAPGRGLKLALITLNTGRLTVPAAVTSGAKRCLQIVRQWANERKQWGSEIGKHEAITAKITQMTSTIFAMDSVTWLVSLMADQGKVDMRLEAAMSKLFCTEQAWRIADDTVQIRGGRGYETAESLKARGEKPIAAERILRDSRINLIIEGTSEIMHLFIAREAMDWHLRLATPILSPRSPFLQKLKGIVRAGFTYAFWYPRLWFWPKYFSKKDVPCELKGHLCFLERSSRRLARNLFHAMMLYQQKLERKQMVLFRLVNIGTEILAMAAGIAHAAHLQKEDDTRKNSTELCDVYCRAARRRIEEEFGRLFSNDDAKIYSVGRKILDGEYQWLEHGIMKQD